MAASWQQVASFVYHGVPVTKYRSQSSGLSVVLAQVQGIARAHRGAPLSAMQDPWSTATLLSALRRTTTMAARTRWSTSCSSAPRITPTRACSTRSLIAASRAALTRGPTWARIRYRPFETTVAHIDRPHVLHDLHRRCRRLPSSAPRLPRPHPLSHHH